MGRLRKDVAVVIWGTRPTKDFLSWAMIKSRVGVGIVYQAAAAGVQREPALPAGRQGCRRGWSYPDLRGLAGGAELASGES